MKLISVVGARPNFMKIAPIIRAINKHNLNAVAPIEHFLVHTGQHYDKKMSKLFFEDLEIPVPDVNLEVGSGSHAEQTAEVIKRFEKVCLAEKPTHVLVVGDVNSTIASALVASKLNIKIIHVEAGLRSFDRTMPEEINRVLTDSISDILFTTEKAAGENLMKEGVPEEKIFFVGNVMIDTLLKHKKKTVATKVLDKLGLRGEGDEILPYAVLTLHRPSNVDDKQLFGGLIDALLAISKKARIIFPVHPRTRKNIEAFGLRENFVEGGVDESADDARIHLVNPLGYLDFLALMIHARLVLTDSGGIQEETTVLGVPCVTLRENTERPVTVSDGTNVIAGTEPEKIVRESLALLDRCSTTVPAPVPPLWDGNAAERIVKVLVNQLP
jgi:UDP-N-acetylglucosamine 2-epimerase (non-hydrolysing)